MRLIIDTNFWIYIAKYGLFDKLREMGIEPVLLGPVKRELESLSKSRGEGKDASVALEMIKRWNLNVEEVEERVADDAIFRFAKKSDMKVATMDRELSDRLKKEGIGIMKIRQKRDFLEE